MRLLRPVASSIVIVTLALGVGANTAVFSVVNSLLLRSLPVPEPERLVTVSSDFALGHGFKAGVGWNYAMWTRMLRSRRTLRRRSRVGAAGVRRVARR